MNAILWVTHNQRRAALAGLLSALNVSVQMINSPAETGTPHNFNRANLLIIDIQTVRDINEKLAWCLALQRAANRAGYFKTSRCFAFVNDAAAADLVQTRAGRYVQVIRSHTASDTTLIADFVENLRSLPILTIHHTAAVRNLGLCSQGEEVASVSYQSCFLSEPRRLELFRFTRIVIDAVLRYSPPGMQRDLDAILATVPTDPFYMSLLDERSLTRRNVIQAWYRLKQALKSVAGDDAQKVARSLKIGREVSYSIDAECELIHS